MKLEEEARKAVSKKTTEESVFTGENLHPCQLWLVD